MTLQAHRLTCARGERHLFKALCFEIKNGDALRIAGANGSGKTSLLRLLCGLAFPAEGKVTWGGADVRSIREEFHSQLIYLGHASGVKDDLTAWENLVVASTLSGRSVDPTQAWKALTLLGLAEAAHLPAASLSQGQRKKVALARLWLDMPARIWVLDEPFTALDSDAINQLCARLDMHLAAGGILVYTTHQDIELTEGRMLRVDLGAEEAC